MRRLNRNDPDGMHTPLLLAAKFDTYRNSTQAVALVRELVMTNVGRSLLYWKHHEETLPVKLLLAHGLAALKFLHENGVYHCDISSGNIAYDRLTNRFRLIDFGQSTFSFAPTTRDDLQPLEVLDTDLRPYAACAVPSEAFLSDSCRESNAIVHLIDAGPVDGYVFLGDQDLTTFAYRDIGLVLIDSFQRRSFNKTYDVYSLGMVVVETMGFDIHRCGFNAPIVDDFCYVDVMNVKDGEAGKLYMSRAVDLCRRNNHLRGGLFCHELEFWKEYVNSDPSIVEALAEDEDRICDLDWAARIFGSDVIETVKIMIHPIPEFRNLGDYSMQPASDDFDDDDEDDFYFHIAIPTDYKKVTKFEKSTIVAQALWAIPNEPEKISDDHEGEEKRREIAKPTTFCSVGSVCFRRELDLEPDRVYVERICIQPKYGKHVRRLLRRALQKSCSLFDPQLSRDRPVDVTILVANDVERDLIASSFPRHAKEADKRHMKIVQWQIFDSNEPKPVGDGRI